MSNAMVCQSPQDELRVKQGDGAAFVVKKRDMWSCNKGRAETVENIGKGVVIMREIDPICGAM